MITVWQNVMVSIGLVCMLVTVGLFVSDKYRASLIGFLLTIILLGIPAAYQQALTTTPNKPIRVSKGMWLAPESGYKGILVKQFGDSLVVKRYETARTINLPAVEPK